MDMDFTVVATATPCWFTKLMIVVIAGICHVSKEAIMLELLIHAVKYFLRMHELTLMRTSQMH